MRTTPTRHQQHHRRQHRQPVSRLNTIDRRQSRRRPDHILRHRDRNQRHNHRKHHQRSCAPAPHANSRSTQHNHQQAHAQHQRRSMMRQQIIPPHHIESTMHKVPGRIRRSSSHCQHRVHRMLPQKRQLRSGSASSAVSTPKRATIRHHDALATSNNCEADRGRSSTAPIRTLRTRRPAQTSEVPTRYTAVWPSRRARTAPSPQSTPRAPTHGVRSTPSTPPLQPTPQRASSVRLASRSPQETAHSAAAEPPADSTLPAPDQRSANHPTKAAINAVNQRTSRRLANTVSFASCAILHPTIAGRYSPGG